MNFGLKMPRSIFGLSMYHDWAYLCGEKDDNDKLLRSFEKINLTTGDSIALSSLPSEILCFNLSANRN